MYGSFGIRFQHSKQVFIFWGHAGRATSGQKPVTLRSIKTWAADEFPSIKTMAMRAAVLFALVASAAAFSAPSMAGLKLRQSKTGVCVLQLEVDLRRNVVKWPRSLHLMCRTWRWELGWGKCVLDYRSEIMISVLIYLFYSG